MFYSPKLLYAGNGDTQGLSVRSLPKSLQLDYRRDVQASEIFPYTRETVSLQSASTPLMACASAIRQRKQEKTNKPDSDL